MPKTVYLEGHGTWHASDGQFLVPEGVTLSFHSNHGELVPGDIGRYSEVKQSIAAGVPCRNYRLWPLYGGNTLTANNVKRLLLDDLGAGDNMSIVSGVHAWGIELAYIAHVLAGWAGAGGVTAHWLACREVVADDAAMRAKNRVGVSIELFQGVKDNEGGWPSKRNGDPVSMMLPGHAVGPLQPYVQWAITQNRPGVMAWGD